MIKDNPTKHMDAFQNLTSNTLHHSYTFVYCTIEPPKNTDNGWQKMKCFSTLPKYLNLSSHEGCTITMWTEARVLRHAFSFLGKEFLSTINKFRRLILQLLVHKTDNVSIFFVSLWVLELWSNASVSQNNILSLAIDHTHWQWTNFSKDSRAAN